MLKVDVNQYIQCYCSLSLHWVSKPDTSDEYPIVWIPSQPLTNILVLLGLDSALLVSAGNTHRKEYIIPCLQQARTLGPNETVWHKEQNGQL